jgi:hypothetical protein
MIMSKIFKHPNYSGPRAELEKALAATELGRFIFVVGPSGVGKTTVRHSIIRKLYGQPEKWAAGTIPYIEVFAMLPQNAYFSSLGFAESLLQQLFVPNVAWMRDSADTQNHAYIALKAEVQRAHSELCGVPLPKLSERKVWDKFQSLSASRGVLLAAVDQAHAMCTNHRDKNPADHILNLMSILEQCEMNFLLSGVHRTAELWLDRPEVRRRSDVIWMPPYRLDRAKDREPFLEVLKSLSEGYSFSKSSLLMSMVDDLMAASAGIIGVLKKILADAKKRAELGGRHAITKSDVSNSYYGDADYKKMWGDVKFFQEIMKSADTKAMATKAASGWRLTEQSKKNHQEGATTSGEAGN